MKRYKIERQVVMTESRFDMFRTATVTNSIQEDDNGDWVKWEDVDKIIKENKEFEKILCLKKSLDEYLRYIIGQHIDERNQEKWGYKDEH